MVKSANSRKQTKRGGTRRNGVISAPNPWSTNGASPEAKYFANAGGNTQLFHNTAALFYNANLLTGIPPGTGIGSRLGLKIFVKNVTIQMMLNNKQDRPNVTYRVVMIATPNYASADTFGECFMAGNITGVHYPSNSLVLHDSVFPINQGGTQTFTTGAGRERSHPHFFSVPIGRAVTYDTTTATPNTNLSCYVVAYDAFGTLVTDNIASIAQWSWRIDFTDA